MEDQRQHPDRHDLLVRAVVNFLERQLALPRLAFDLNLTVYCWSAAAAAAAAVFFIGPRYFRTHNDYQKDK